MKPAKLIHLSLLLIFMFLGTALVAQQSVTGKVQGTDGEPLIGVNVLIKGTSTGTITDIDGSYQLDVPSPEAVLVFSYTGYNVVEVAAGNQSIISVTLEEGLALDEIVVVGYATQKKANLTGAVTSIGTDELEDRPLTSAATALQGAAPGVFVNQNSGQPGRDNVLIRIRGTGTLNNANPLVLVDGIEAPISNLNPDDIESITVLKDAASASIYGSRAANGVVLVTTKRGTGQEGVSFNYNGYYGISEAIRLPEIVDDAATFAELWNEANTNFGERPKFSDAEIADFRANGPNSNWFDELFSRAPISQHNFSVSGNSGKTNFRYSLGYLYQDGVVPKADFNRFSTRLNLDTRIIDGLSMGVNLSLIRGDRNSHADNLTAGGDASIIANITRSQPVDQIKNEDAIPIRPNYGLNNARLALNRRDFNRIDNDVLGSTYIEYEFFEGFKVKGTAAVNYRHAYDRNTRSSIPTADPLTGEVTSDPETARSASRSTFNSLNLTTWLQATYEKSFGPHQLKFLGGFNQETNQYEAFSASRNTFISNNILTLNAGDPSTANNGESATHWALQSYFGRANYVFNDRYLFEANLRYDGSSRFKNDKWGLFPSFSAGWIISEENFFNLPGVDFLKLRASWGQLGNQNIGNFRYSRNLSLTENYTYGGSIVQGVAQTSLGNPDLRWEFTTSSNVGINLTMLDSKLSIEADYFTRLTEDILFNIPVPSISGFGSQIRNSASVENKGWEFSATYRERIGDNLTVSVSGNVTNVKNEVIELNKSLGENEVDRQISQYTILQPGSPISAYFGYKALGIFRTQAQFDAAADHSGINPLYGVGDVQLEDLNGDGVIGPDDRQVIGNQAPEWIFGFNLSVAFKGLELSVIAQGAGNYQTYGYSHLFWPFDNSHTVEKRWLDRYTPENTDATMPRIFLGGDGWPSTSVNNSFWLLDRSHLRIRNVQLAYTFPESIVGNSFIRDLKVYINAQNIATFTNFPFMDPERPGGSNRASSGFPNLAIFSGGVNLNF
ncbi:MAG: TonB-dependent receptor [Saprospiraceae bacterium]|nr:TonB-dependent receptor [Saprospiraceae bacterium]